MPRNHLGVITPMKIKEKICIIGVAPVPKRQKRKRGKQNENLRNQKDHHPPHSEAPR